MFLNSITCHGINFEWVGIEPVNFNSDNPNTLVNGAIPNLELILFVFSTICELHKTSLEITYLFVSQPNQKNRTG